MKYCEICEQRIDNRHGVYNYYESTVPIDGKVKNYCFECIDAIKNHGDPSYGVDYPSNIEPGWNVDYKDDDYSIQIVWNPKGERTEICMMSARREVAYIKKEKSESVSDKPSEYISRKIFPSDRESNGQVSFVASEAFDGKINSIPCQIERTNNKDLVIEINLPERKVKVILKDVDEDPGEDIIALDEKGKP